MNKRLIFRLLRTYAQVSLDGKEKSLQKAGLEFLMYLTIKDEPKYDRADLAQSLYGRPENVLVDPDPKGHLRKGVLPKILQEVKDVCLYEVHQATIGFDNSEVWVDVVEFQKLSQIDKSLEGDFIPTEQLEALLSAVALYEGDLVSTYKSDIHEINDWLLDTRLSLRTQFHSVLERLIRHYITVGSYEEARVQAEKWWARDRDNMTPLQFLIWLSARLHLMDRFRHYLTELDELQKTQFVPFGKVADDWRILIELGHEPTIDDIGIKGRARYSPSDLLNIAKQHVVGYDRQLMDIFDHLIVHPSDGLCVLLGASGSGKSLVAEAVALTWEHLGDTKKSIHIALTQDTHPDDILDQLASALERPHLHSLMFHSKRESIRELLQPDTHMLIFDQDETGDVFPQEIIDLIAYFSQGVPVLVCTEEAWDTVEPIRIWPVSASNIDDLFSKFRIARGTVSIRHHERDLVNICEGEHEKLFLLANTFDIHGLSLGEALQSIKQMSGPDPLLSWLWQQLDASHHDALTVIGMFDPIQRSAETEIAEILGIPAAQNIMVLQDLKRRGIIEVIEGRIRIAGTLYRFLKEEIHSKSGSDDVINHIQTRFVEYQLALASTYIDQPQQLDRDRRNIVKAYEIAIHQGANFDAAIFGEFVRYLQGRGYRAKAWALISEFSQSDRDWNNRTGLELRRIMAEIVLNQGDAVKAREMAEQTLNDVLPLDDNCLLGRIYETLGKIHRLERSDQAMGLLENACYHAYRAEDAYVLATAHANMGGIAWSQGKPDDAIVYLKKSLEFAEGSEAFLPIENYAATTLAIIELENENYDLCHEYLQTAQDTSQAMGNVERKAFTQLNQAALHFALREPKQALTLLEQALLTARNIENISLEMSVIRNMGRNHLLLDHQLEAQKELRQALLLSKSTNDKRSEAAILVDLARYWFTYARWPEAEKFYESALCAADELQHAVLTAEAIYGLCLTEIMARSIIELDDPEGVLIGSAPKLKQSLSQIQQTVVEAEHLYQAERYFRKGPDNVPVLANRSFVELIVKWILGDGDTPVRH
ncbi:MAG: hypothetical protein KC708_01670 [Anaerolineae bacterium]|nr:hypothetical protein [Anaerolineae bacterium]